MKKKDKLNLIDNYVSIFQLLYNCKNIVLDYNQQQSIGSLSSLTSQIIELKKNYENAFDKLGIIDETFLQLQKELNNCILDTPRKPYFNLDEITSRLSSLQSDYYKLKDKHSF